MAVKLDIIGSSQTKGYHTILHDRAVRIGKVTDLTNNADKLGEAIEAAEIASTLLHHQNETLPLGRITATSIGVTKARVVMEYFRRPQTFSFPNENPFTIARFRGSFVGTRWYKRPFDAQGQPAFTDFRPSGPAEFRRTPDSYKKHPDAQPPVNTLLGYLLPPHQDPFAIPIPWEWVRPTYRIYVPVLLTIDPTAAVGPLLGKTNSDPVTLGQLVISPGSVRFDGVDTDWLNTSVGNNVFAVYYKFTAVQGGFFQQIAYPPGPIEQGGSGTSIWTFVDRPEYLTAPFLNAFPISPNP